MIEEHDLELITGRVVEKVKTEVIREADLRYRKIEDCDEITDDLKEEIHSEDRRLVAIETQLKVITWLIAGVGGGVITMLVKMFFGG